MARANPGERAPRVVLVTGATTGIGLALAKVMLRGDWRLVLTASEASLTRFKQRGIVENERLWVRALDVTKPEQANALIAEIESLWQGVDVLINNAGICYRAVIEHLRGENEEHQLRVNYLGPFHLIRLVLPGMRARRSGHIINLSSVGGMMAMPTMGAYSASKFALEGASEALWYELKPWGIHVTLIEPGFVHSHSFENALFTRQSRDSFEHAGTPYHAYYAGMMGLISRLMRGSATTPDDIARKILKTINRKRPPLRLPATRDAVFFHLLRRLLPMRLYHWVLYQGLPGIKSWVPPQKEE